MRKIVVGSSLFWLTLCFQATPVPAAASETTTIEGDDTPSLLVLGDSWASLLPNDVLRQLCGGSSDVPSLEVQNDSQSGSTAAEWVSQTKEVVQSSSLQNVDYVWLSVGRKDFLDSRCEIEVAAQVAENVVDILSQIVAATNSTDLKILYPSYIYPPDDVCGYATTAALLDAQNELIQDAIRNSNYSDYVTLIDVSDEFVTAQSAPLSDAKWYEEEAMHLNQNGYNKLLSNASIQQFFGCSKKNNDGTRDWSLPKIFGALLGMLIFLLILGRLSDRWYHRRNEEQKSNDGTATGSC
eukprot:scaffold328_cov130-Cylindrotheca_fusiformis.AAC.22